MSGSELGWFQTIPLRARNRTNFLTDKDYFSHPVSLRVTPVEPLCWYRCWYGAGWSKNGLPIPTGPLDGIRSPPTGCGFMSELTDKELKNLKPRAKLYKVTDRDGMYAAVTPTGVVSFRYQYRVNGRQEVLTIGRYSAEAARKLTRAPDVRSSGESRRRKPRWRSAPRQPRR